MSSAFSLGGETPPQEEDKGMGTEASSDEGPDSLDLLMMEAELVPSTGARFHCLGESGVFHRGGYVGSGELDRMAKGQTPTPHLAGSTVRLFGFDFPMCDLLLHRCQDVLVKLFLQRMQLVESSSLGINAGGGGGGWKDSASEAREFLAYVRHVSYNYVGYAKKADEQRVEQISYGDDCLSRLLRLLHLMHLHAGRLSSCPPGGVMGMRRGGEDREEDSDPACCLAHLRLDCRWTVFSAAHHLSRRPGAAAAAAPTLVVPKFVDFRGLPPIVLNTEEDSTPLGDLKKTLGLQILSELAGACADRFSLLGVSRAPGKTLSASPFSCECARELWFLVMHSFPEAQWKFAKVLLPTSASHQSAGDELGGEVASSVPCRMREMPRLCAWWLLEALVAMWRLDPRGEERGGGSPFDSDLRDVEDKLLEATLAGEMDESELRSIISLLARMSDSLGGPSHPSMLALLEHFLYRLDYAFVDKKNPFTIGQIAVLPKSVPDWATRLHQLDSAGSGNNSFELFLDLLYKVAEKAEVSGKKQYFTKLASEIKRKLSTPGILRNLNEHGWFNFFQLALKMAKGSSVIGSTEHLKWMNFVADLLKGGRSGTKSQMVLMGLAVMARQGFSFEANPSCVLELFMSRVNGTIQTLLWTSNESAKTCQEAMKVYTDLVEECLAVMRDSSVRRGRGGVSEPLLCQTCLLSGAFAKYLGRCTSAEMGRLVTVLVTLVSKMRKFYKEERHRGDGVRRTEEEQRTVEGVDAMQKALWENIFPTIQKNLCSAAAKMESTVTSKLAELCTSLVLLSMEKPDGNRDPERLLEFFAFSPAVRPELRCQFLLDFLQQGGHAARGRRAFTVLGHGGDGGDDPVVRGWVRCAVFGAVEEGGAAGGDYQSCLAHLSEEVLGMAVFRDLDVPQECANEDDDGHGDGHGHDSGHGHDDGHGDATSHRNTLGKVFAAIEAVCARDSLQEARFQPFLAETVDQMTSKWALSRDRPRGSEGLYRLAGSLVGTCSRLLYSRRPNEDNLLNRVIAGLLKFPDVWSPDKRVPIARLDATAAFLPLALKGLSSVEACNADAFVVRTLEELFVIYLQRFDAKRSPFLLLFSPAFQVQNRPWLQGQLFKVIRSEFFQSGSASQNGLMPKNNLRQNRQQALAFLLEAAKRGCDCDCDGEGQDKLLSRLCFNFCYDSSSAWVKSYPDDKQTSSACFSFLKFVIGRNAERGGKAPDLVEPHLRTLLDKEMAFNSRNVFWLLKLLCALDKSLVKRLMPHVEATVAEIERRRGNVKMRRDITELKRLVL